MGSRRTSVLATVLATAAGVAAAACGDRGPPGPTVTVRDSAGVAIVDNPSPDDSLANRWWRLEGPDVDIGGIEAVEPYALFRVADALRGDDGSFVVANSASAEIRYFDEDGVHLRTVGGEGDGPGEYRTLSSLHRGAADSLLVVDARARRISVLDREGRYVRGFGAEGPSTVGAVVGRFMDGSLLAAPSLPLDGGFSAREISGDEITRADVALVRIAADGATSDTIATHPGRERVVRIMGRGGGVDGIVSISVATPPLGRTPAFAVFADRFHVATQDAPEIRVFREDGSLRSIVRTGRAPEPLTDAHVEALEERRIRSLPEERRAEARAAGGYREMPRGDLVPPYGSILVDLEGNLWVSDYGDPTDPPGRWTVYDPERSSPRTHGSARALHAVRHRRGLDPRARAGRARRRARAALPHRASLAWARDASMAVQRCSWPRTDLDVAYHDEEWGVPVHDDRVLFEFLILEGAQAGLSWSTILRKREHYRRAFARFDPAKVAKFTAAKLDRLLKDPGIVRNRLKVESARSNARAFLDVQDEHGSFDVYLWRFVGGRPRQNAWRSLREIQSTTPESDALSKDLKRRGFRFVGSTICYAFMQAVGMVNDHVVGCFRHGELGGSRNRR